MKLSRCILRPADGLSVLQIIRIQKLFVEYILTKVTVKSKTQLVLKLLL